jgi:5-formyltetrahydrofolate cyclo-ligase
MADLTKAALRRELLRRRAEHWLSRADARAEADRHLCEKLFQHLGRQATPDVIVSLYIPLRAEVPVTDLTDRLRKAGYTLALPRVATLGAPLVFNVWDGTPPADRDAKGIPCATGDEVTPDFVVVPMVGFDRRGHRLGYGAGMFDRTLAAFGTSVRTVGVAYQMQEVPHIPDDAHDHPLDWIVTEREVIKCR